jgi:hypothetical protein
LGKTLIFSLLYLAIHKRDVKSLSSTGTNQLIFLQIIGSKNKAVNDKMTRSATQEVPFLSFSLSFFLSVLVLTSFYQIIVGKEVILTIHRTQTQARAPQDSFGREIGPLMKPLPENKQQS